MSPSLNDNPIHEVFPYLRVRNAASAIEFYKQVFGAIESYRLTEPSGRIGHAELKFGPLTVMLSDEYPEHGINSLAVWGGAGSMLHLHVADVDAMTERAVKLGAKLLMAPQDQFYGERGSKILDPYGHEWMLGQEIEQVSPEEMQRRYTALMRQGG